MAQLSTFFIEEPKLIFGNDSRCQESKGGLYLYGPYGKYSGGEPTSIVADVGVIGSSKSISDTVNFFEQIRTPIPTTSVGGIHFPGLGVNGKLHFDLKFDEQWQETINASDIEECRDIEKREDRIDYFLKLLEGKIKSIHSKQPNPTLTICALPLEMIRLLKSPEQEGYRVTITHRRFAKSGATVQQLKGDYDLHNIVKVFGLKYEMPTQLILPNTLDVTRVRKVQDLATRAWNISMALYYKSRGIPWKIAQLESGTCYAGISFYRELDEEMQPSMKAAITHLFLATGECLVLTGQPFKWAESGTAPRLTKEQARTVRKQIVDAYKNTHGQAPSRLVIHKKTLFSEEEKAGFTDCEDSVRQTDLLTIQNSSINWYRNGKWPILRNTVIKCPGPEYFIFTLGYIQEMQTFPKPGAPIPIRVEPCRLDSTETKMCREILALSKLNWNNTDFSDQFPVTLSVSDTISEILSEARARDIVPSDQYRYYM